MNYPSKRSLLAAALALGLNFVPGLTVLAAGMIGATILFKKQRETGRSRHGRPGLTHRLSGAVFPNSIRPSPVPLWNRCTTPLEQITDGRTDLVFDFLSAGHDARATDSQDVPRIRCVRLLR